MTRNRLTRRTMLSGVAMLTATATIGLPTLRAAPTKQHGEIDAVLRRATEAKEVPGVVAMAANDRGIFCEGAFGARDLGKGPAMTPDTIFRMASMTKAITSVAAMQLVEQRRLDLDAPIGNVLPSCRRRKCWRALMTPGRQNCARQSGRSR